MTGRYWWSSRDSSYAMERFDFADGTQWSLADIKYAAWSGTSQDDVFTGDGGNNQLSGAEGNDVLDGDFGDDKLSGGEGNDVLLGGVGDDLLEGGAGNDTLQGENGNDVLDGGAGDDQLYAGYGADTIRFGRGDGKDVLARDSIYGNYFYSVRTGQPMDPMGNNVVEFKAGVNPADVKLARDGNTLNIHIRGTDDVLTVKDFYITRYSWDTPVDLNFSLREIRFEDGTVWAPADILAQTLVGDETDETFTGFETDDVFNGGGGNDRLYGVGGSDTYLFGRGDGVDRVTGAMNNLVFKEGVNPGDVMVRRMGDAAVFTIRDTSDSVTFDYAYPSWAAGLANFEEVRFADGTIWTPEQINEKALEGTDGDDVISDLGISGNEVLAGGAGNDTLIGQRTGATVYAFNRGDGQDVVDEGGSYSYNDTLRFGADIVATDLVVRTRGEDLVIGIAGTSDQVTVKRHANSVVEKFEVGGVTLSYQEILSLIPNYGTEYIYGSDGDDYLAGTDKDSLMYGFGGGDTMAGNGGSDVLNGAEGNDVLAGGTERDILSGGLGSNVYRYNRGDGLDTIVLTPGASDVIELGLGITPGDISVQLGEQLVWRDGQYMRQMVIGFGGNDALVLEVPFASDFSSALQATGTLVFANDGVNYYGAYALETLLDMATADGGVVGYGSRYAYGGEVVALRGSQADDRLYTEGGPEAFIAGRDNNDYLRAYGADAVLDGGNGSDELGAEGGGAVMAGGLGRDTIYARSYGDGINTMSFNLGDGRDRIEGGGSNGLAVVSFGVGIDPSSLRMRIDSNGDLVISIAGSEGDEIRSAWYQNDLGSPAYLRGIGQLQFIDAEGRVRLFDMARLDELFDFTVLAGPQASDGLAVLALAPELEVQGPSSVYGGIEAMSYAQWGEFGRGAYVSANDEEIWGADYLSGDNLLFGTRWYDEMYAGAGNDVVMAGADGDVLYGEDGNDYLDGQKGDDWLFGGAGDDVLMGGAGEDVLIAGTGSNQAYGGAGDDRYYFERGNGFLYIDDGASFDGGEGGYGGNDYNTLEFGEGISLEDLIFEREGDNLKVTVGGAQGDVVVLAGFNDELENRNRSIDRLVFNDGASSVTIDELLQNQGDSLLLSRGDGELDGTVFNDHLQGGLGDDVLDGRYGDDRLEGGAGNDAYVLNYGSGNDVIVDTARDDNIIVVSDWSVSVSDVFLQTENGEAGVWIGDRFIKLEGWDGQDPAQAPISSLIFADGSTLSMADLLNQSRMIRGTPQDDVLQGGAGADVIWGLQGNDLMQGGAGADTYVIEAGSGADTISDTYAPGEENSILFLDGTEPEDIRLTLDQDRNLVLKWRDGSQITLTEDFDYLDPNEPSSIMYFQFGATGPVLSYQELLERGFEIDGTTQNDVLYTTGQHDVVNAGDGDDMILGSTGGDNLNGGGGNDLYEYRLGDGWVGITDVADGAGGNVVRFGEGITPEMLERKLRFNYFPDEPEENSLRIVFDEVNILQLNGFNPLNPEGSPHAVEYFEFADGTVLSWDQLLDKVFVVEGDFGDEELTGTNRSDRLYGYEGNDVLVGRAGDDVLTGASGADVLQGGTGADNYVFQLGDGADTIMDDGVQANTITFGAGVFEADISVERDGADFVVRYGSLGDTIRIASADGVNTPSGVIDHFELADGTLVPFAQFTNHAPEAGDPLQNQQGRVGEGLGFEFSGGAFTDADGSELSYRAQLSDGQPLPDWLNFNPQTRTFSGMPPLEAVGSYEIAVFAVDPSGAAMQQVFSLAVDGLPNHAPEAMADQAEVQEDLLIETTGNVLANDLDVDADTVLSVSNAGTIQGLWGELELQVDGTYVYRLDNSNSQIQALGQGQSETDVFNYTVSDGADSTTSQLVVTIVGSNDGPVLTADQGGVQEDGVVEVTGSVLANDTDVDGDSLAVADAGTYVGVYGTLTLLADGSYSYVLDNGSEPVQGLQAGAVVQEEFVFHVTDGTASAAGSLSISVVGTNDGPLVFADTASVLEDTQPTADGNVLANDQDGDAGGSLQIGNAGMLQGQYGTLTLGLDGSYSYALYDDASVQSLAAGQGVTEVFNYSATDGSDASTTTLTVTVTGENDAPIIVASVAAQTGREGQVFSFVLPESMALDVDQGDVLSYAIGLANGDALPAWLSFDPANRMLSGTPGDSDAGVFALRVTVTDASGASASSLFDLSIEDGVCTVGGVFDGTAQGDVINGTECADVINGLAGNDQLYGQGGNDVINGGLGADVVSGGAGNDSLQMSIDALWGWGNFARHRGSPGVSGTGARVSLHGMNRSLDMLDGGSGWDTLVGTAGSDAVILDAGSGSQPQLRDVEQFDLGAGNDVLDLTSTRFSYGATVVNGGTGNDTLWSSGGNDRLYGGAGSDVIDAGAGNDFVDGGDQDDRLVSLLGYGNDIVRGGSGNDVITDLSGQNLLEGGAGADILFDGNGSSVLIGARGNDILKLGRGQDVIVFNRGDGRDTVIGGDECDANDTLVLGGGIRYEDLSFRRDGRDLVLNIGQEGCHPDQIRFADWYEGNRTIDRLEIAIDTSDAYQSDSLDTLLNKQVQSFDFGGLVQRFNTEFDAGCGYGHSGYLQSWSFAASLMEFHLGGSDDLMTGGDLAHYYTHQGTMSGLSLGVAHVALGDGMLGKAQQEVSSMNAQMTGAVRL
ncbi:MAG: VCBS domain-containing protein [Hylemonella sp.]